VLKLQLQTERRIFPSQIPRVWMATILEEYYASGAHSFRVQEQRMLNLTETPSSMLYR
jgi:hypothetical protein